MEPVGTVLLPTRYKQATLVDLLDRALDKGLVIDADLLVSVAGIPLLGVNLRAALAGMETMLRYGLMRDWDERTREEARTRAGETSPIPNGDETLLLRMYGAHWFASGIYRAWRPGYLHLTDKRLSLLRAEPREVLLDLPLTEIRGFAIRKEPRFLGAQRALLYLALRQDRTVYVYAERPQELAQGIAGAVEALGLPPIEPVTPPVIDDGAELLLPEEVIAAEGKMWYQLPPAGLLADTWRPGRLYLTAQRLFWWCDTDRQIRFEVPAARLLGAEVEVRDLGGLIGRRPILCLHYRNSRKKEAALFTSKALAQWKEALGRVVAGVDTCPGCGASAPRERLLQEGCPGCGWTSPVARGKAVAVAIPSSA